MTPVNQRLLIRKGKKKKASVTGYFSYLRKKNSTGYFKKKKFICARSRVKDFVDDRINEQIKTNNNTNI